MSALTRPSGPLPARVYWIRRGIVLLLALLLVFLFAKVLGGGSDGKADPDAQAEAASGEVGSQDADESMDDAAGQGDRADRAGKATKAPLADPDGACDPAEVTITPLIKKVANDGKIDFKVAVTGSRAACTWTFSHETVALKIVSGRDEVWSSQQCQGMLPEKDLVVRSGVQSKVSLTWDGRRSDTGCTRRRGWAQPGYYHAIIAAMGGEPTDVQFRVTGPPTEVVTVTPKPEPTPKQARKPAASPRG